MNSDSSEAPHNADEPLTEPSKSQRKREADAIRVFAASLVELPARKLNTLPLDQHIRDAIDNCPPASTRGARKRHLQFLGKLLRKADNVEQLQQLLDNPTTTQKSPIHKELLDTLLDDFAAAATTLRDCYPQLSLQQARQLVRQVNAAESLADIEKDELTQSQLGTIKKAAKAKKNLLTLLQESYRSIE